MLELENPTEFQKITLEVIDLFKEHDTSLDVAVNTLYKIIELCSIQIVQEELTTLDDLLLSLDKAHWNLKKFIRFHNKQENDKAMKNTYH